MYALLQGKLQYYCTENGAFICSWECCELEHFCYNVEACGHLPQKQTNVYGVESDVEASGGIVTLLHGRYESSSHSPEHHHTCSCIQVWSREELSCSEECVARASNGHQHTESEDERSPVVVLVVQFLSNQILSLLQVCNKVYVSCCVHPQLQHRQSHNRNHT